MRISDLMITPPVTVSSAATVRMAATRMDEHQVGSVLVADGGALRGVLTDRDVVVRTVAPGLGGATRVCDVMSAPAVTVDIADSVDAAYHAFRRSGFRRLPVLDGRLLVGVLAVDDLLLDVFQRFADLLGPVAWSMLREPAAPQPPHRRTRSTPP